METDFVSSLPGVFCAVHKTRPQTQQRPWTRDERQMFEEVERKDR